MLGFGKMQYLIRQKDYHSVIVKEKEGYWTVYLLLGKADVSMGKYKQENEKA